MTTGFFIWLEILIFDRHQPWEVYDRVEEIRKQVRDLLIQKSQASLKSHIELNQIRLTDIPSLIVMFIIEFQISTQLDRKKTKNLTK